MLRRSGAEPAAAQEQVKRAGEKQLGGAPDRTERPGCLVLALNRPSEEIFGLLRTLDLPVRRIESQTREEPHPRTFFGPGRLKDVIDSAGPEIDHVVVDAALTPPQHCNLERLARRSVLDRVDVILRIFVQHAQTPEAVAQVTIASLRRELPLIRERLHQIKAGERAGFLAGGTYVTDAYYEQARRSLRRQERTLRQIRSQRALRRGGRAGVRTAALVGYTNSGKTSLLNALTGSEAFVDDELFSTLSPTVRRLPGSRPPLLVSDTVGFLQDLPPPVVSAFQATLEEALKADQLLVVVDVGDAPEILQTKARAVDAAIASADAYETLWIVGTKCDLIAGARRAVEEALRNVLDGRRFFWTSTVSGEGVKELRSALLEPPEGLVAIELELPEEADSGSFLSWLYMHAHVDGAPSRNPIRVTARIAPAALQQARHRLQDVGGVLRIINRAEGPER